MRDGQVAPRTYTKVLTSLEDKEVRFEPSDYEPLNRNRLIALMAKYNLIKKYNM